MDDSCEVRLPRLYAVHAASATTARAHHALASVHHASTMPVPCSNSAVLCMGLIFMSVLCRSTPMCRRWQTALRLHVCVLWGCWRPRSAARSWCWPCNAVAAFVDRLPVNCGNLPGILPGILTQPLHALAQPQHTAAALSLYLAHPPLDAWCGQTTSQFHAAAFCCSMVAVPIVMGSLHQVSGILYYPL